MAHRLQPVDNLIQGVSQQSPQQRRDSQCEAQQDCFNSPKDGCVARNGFEVTAYLNGSVFTDAFTYEIFRGPDEHYRVFIVGGSCRVFNLETGVECTVTDVSGATYRTMGVGTVDRDNWAAQTVDDFTFFANKTITPAMAGTVSPSRPKEAMLFIRGSAYQCKYSITLNYAGNTYKWVYKTADNTHPLNAKYIETGMIAASFFRAMTGTTATTQTSPGSGGTWDGDTGGSGAIGTPAEGLTEMSGGLLPTGFNLQINGNLLRLWRDDGVDFDVDITDGNGGNLTEAFKENARNFGDLPKSGFEGFTLKVRGLKSDAADDYYVRYATADNADGFWQEVVAPNVPTSLDPATMPHALVNTGVNTFEWRQLAWSTRIAGDETTSRTPRFVGKPIEDLFYHKRRFGILSEAAIEWSKSQVPFTFFRDTVQTVLATDPISTDLSTSDTIALARRTVEVDESLYVWAQGVQFRTTSGNNEVFRQDTVEAPATTFYEFAEHAGFARIGTTLYFATEPGNYATVRNLVFQNGKPAGDVDVTAHVSAYIPYGVRGFAASDTLRTIFVMTDENVVGLTPVTKLYLYNYLTQDRNFVQSAWNVWNLPFGIILSASIYRSKLYVTLQRSHGVHLLTCDLRSEHVDPGHLYHTRMDLRVDETEMTSLSYNAVDDETTIGLPFQLYDNDSTDIKVAARSNSGGYLRGREFPVLSKAPDDLSLVVKGNLTGVQFYVGLGIRSIRDESEFFVRDQNGIQHLDRLTVDRFTVDHAKSLYYRIEVTIPAGRQFVYEYNARNTDSAAPVIDEPLTPTGGSLTAAVNALSKDASIRLINDSVFPSRWQSAAYIYSGVSRATANK
jgi:hypothetical protein